MRSLRAQTLAVGRRARRQLLWAGPLLALIVVLYLLRGELVGSEQPFRLVVAAAFAITGWVFARSLGHALEPQLAHRVDPGAAGVIGFMIRLVALAVIAFATVRIAGLDPSTLVLGASLTAIILGLAAQQTFGNILAGFVLVATHPFRVGERVRFSGFGMDVEGTIAAHGLLHLTMTDGDDTVKLPNTTALTMSIRPLRQPMSVDMRARLPVGVDPETIQAQVEDSISVSTRDAPHVSLEEFDGYEIVVRIEATPERSEHGARLAGDVLAAVTALRQNAGSKASVGAPSGWD